MVLPSGRGLLGVDHAGAYLAGAHSKFPQVPTVKHDLQELPYQGEFDRVRAGSQAARRLGLPVVDGKVIWGEPDGYYHYNPSMQQVRARLADAGFVIEQEAEGPWQAEGYAYHHVLARLAAPPG
jgi:hypothetical protein